MAATTATTQLGIHICLYRFCSYNDDDDDDDDNMMMMMMMMMMDDNDNDDGDDNDDDDDELALARRAWTRPFCCSTGKTPVVQANPLFDQTLMAKKCW